MKPEDLVKQLMDLADSLGPPPEVVVKENNGVITVEGSLEDYAEFVGKWEKGFKKIDWDWLMIEEDDED